MFYQGIGTINWAVFLLTKSATFTLRNWQEEGGHQLLLNSNLSESCLICTVFTEKHDPQKKF